MGFGGKDGPYTLHDFQSVNVASDGEIFVFLSISLLNDKQAYINWVVLSWVSSGQYNFLSSFID